MKKHFKRIAAVIMSLTMALVGIPLGVSAAETTAVTNLSSVPNLSTIIADKSQNIVKGYTPAQKGTAMTYSVDQTYGTVTNENINGKFARSERVTDGTLSTGHCESQSFCQIPAQGEFVEGYVDFTFTFPSVAEITNVLIASSAENNFKLREYKVYVSNDINSLYSEDNQVYAYEDANGSEGQYLTFGTPVNAQYLGVRISKFVADNLSNNFQYSYCRVREIAVIGSCEIPEKYKIIEQEAANECIAALKTEGNLIQSGYAVSNVANPSSVLIYGANAGVPVREGRISGSNLWDGDVSTCADVALNAITFLDENRNFIEGSYMNIVYVLKERADIEKIFLAQRNDVKFMSRKYEIYIGNDLNALFDEENCYWSFINETNALYQTFKLEESVSAKYVGFRFIEPVTLPEFTLAASNAYPRLGEIAIFGEYNTPNFDYTVSSTKGNFVNDSGNAVIETELSYTVPLTQDGYSFKEWQLNGEKIESEIDLGSNTSTVKIQLMEETDLQAVYDADPTAFSGSKYAVKDGAIRLPFGAIAYDATTGFGQYPANIAVKDGDNLYRGGEYVASGMKLQLYAGGEVADTLDIVTEYDCSGDGKVSVTDITAAIGEALDVTPLSETGRFVFDNNLNGKITVSEVIKARKVVLNSTDAPVDYSTNTLLMKDIDYKQMGRNYIETDGSLNLEMAAAGFSFTADCYGTIEASVTRRYNEAIHFTVIVDGVASIVPFEGSRESKIVLARNLARGKHTIEVYRSEQPSNYAIMKDITISGITMEAPENADLYIEFIGDSITSGGGNLVINGLLTNGRKYDSYLSYSTQTARMLSADWSNISLSGGTLTDNTDASAAYLPQVYKQQTYSKTDAYNFARKADIVVINLGTNDEGKLPNKYPNVADRKAAFKAELDALVDYILENNGTDTKIVFAYGLMTPQVSFVDEVYQATAEELMGEGTTAHYVRLTTRKNGDGGHPDIYDDVEAAKELSQFIRENVL